MNGKNHLILHGEKIAVAVIVLLSGWATYATLNNPLVHPEGVSDVTIDKMITHIETARATQSPPQIKMPPNYVQALDKRLSSEWPVPTYIAWLSGQPDTGPTIANTQSLYMYELLPPVVAGSEHVGMIDVTVTMPDVTQPTEGSRIADGPHREWKSQGGTVVNSVEQVGIILEYSIGSPTGELKPVVAEGIVNGFLPIKDRDQTAPLKVTFRPDSVWETYYLRASVVIRATGYPLERDDADQSPQSVLVYAGRYGTPPTWLDLEAKLHKRDADTLAKFLSPSDRKCPGITLKNGEKLYVSKADISKPLLVTSATRFAFEKSYGDGDSRGASVLVTTLLSPLPGATTSKWLKEPQIYKIKIGDKLGDVRSIVDPRKVDGSKSRIDLTTPFVLAEIKPEVERILYYELVTRSRGASGGNRDLDYKIKTKIVEGAVFKNPTTGQEMTYSRLLKIDKPGANLPCYKSITAGQWKKIDGPFIYPNFPGASYDEADEFRKNPADFKQRLLKPLAPIWHAADEANGPLAEMRQKAGDDFQTDTRYLEFPDGRVFFWDALNKRILSFTAPHAEADAETAKDPAKESSAAAPATPPAPAPTTP